MRSFNYMFLKKDYIPSSFLSYISDIAVSKNQGTQKELEYPEIFKQLKKRAIIASAKYSNAIENILATDKRIDQIVANGALPEDHDEEEIAGYSEALKAIHNDYKNLPFSEDTILELHSLVYSQASSRTGGTYKMENNAIYEYDAQGMAHIRFQPLSAQETPQAMNQLILAYLSAHQEYGIEPLLLIPCVILDFLCIHPFSDGNGRISRLLTVLLLYRDGYNIGRYISIEKEIERTKDYYYGALRESSENWEQNKNSYLPFIKYCLYVVSNCYKELNRQFTSIHGRRGSKSGRVESYIVNSIVPVSRADIEQAVPNVSVATIQQTLNKLLREGKIVKIGTFKNARYRKAHTSNP